MQAIYPTMAIARRNNHRTFEHMYSQHASLPTISQGTNPRHISTIRFAEPDPAASTETLPQQVEKSQVVQLA